MTRRQSYQQGYVSKPISNAIRHCIQNTVSDEVG